MWDLRAGDEDENFQFLEAMYLIVASGNPIFPFRRPKGLVPLWLILQFRFKGTVHDGGDKVWNGGGSCGGDIEGKEIVRIAKRCEFSQKGMNGVNWTNIMGHPSMGCRGSHIRNRSSKMGVWQQAISRCITRSSKMQAGGLPKGKRRIKG